jgi:uncharacterized OsmC-like protein
MKSQQETAKIVNGINVSKISNIINSIKEDKEIAKFNFRVQNKWIMGTENRTMITDFYGASETHKKSKPHVLIKDEPTLLLGNDRGANPVEYLLAGLAGCVTTGLIFLASARGIKIDSIESFLEGDIDLRGLLQLDENVNPGYHAINISFEIKSDASRETLEDLIQLAKKISPVANTVSRPTPVNVRLM